jgi:uncharacterized membrane protein YphA (DoxX/SURF4 family)
MSQRTVAWGGDGRRARPPASAADPAGSASSASRKAANGTTAATRSAARHPAAAASGGSSSPAAKAPTCTLYHDLVFNLLVPNWAVFGPLVGVAEMTAGLLLILGLASALGALLAALLSLHIQFSDATGPWLYEYAVEWVPLLCLAFMRAGRTWGLDARIAGGNPRWKRLFA